VVCESFDVLSCQTALEVERFSQLYMDAWVALDPESTGFIPVEKLQELLESLPLPFGAPKNKSKTLSSYFKSKTVRLKMLFIKRNMTGSSLSFHETFLLLVILHSVEERRLVSVRYVRYVRHIKAKLIVCNFLRVKGKQYALAAKYSKRLTRRLSLQASGRGLRVVDALLSSHSNNRVKNSQRTGVTSSLFRSITPESHAAEDHGRSPPSRASPSSLVSLKSGSTLSNDTLLECRDNGSKVQESAHNPNSSSGGLLNSRLESLKHQRKKEYDVIKLTFPGSLPLPSACICKSSFNAETVCAVSQNERWVPLLGWSPFVLLPSDPGAFSSINRKIDVKLSDYIPLEGPRGDLWVPPEGFEWIPDDSWKLQVMSDRDCDPEGCKF